MKLPAEDGSLGKLTVQIRGQAANLHFSPEPTKVLYINRDYTTCLKRGFYRFIQGVAMKRIPIIISLLLAVSIVLALITQTSPTLTWVRNYSTSVQNNFTITNTGSTTVSSIFFTTTALTSGSNTLSGDIAISPNGTSLTAGQSKDITITITNVPTGQSLGTYTGILTADYSGTQTNSTITVKVEDINSDIDVPSTLSYSNAKRGKSYAKTFTIENDGNTVLNNIALGTTISSSYLPLFNTTSGFFLNPGDTKDVSLNITIPNTETYGNKSLGSISINSNEENFGNVISVNADVVSNLDIADVDVTIGSFSSKSAEESETIDEEAVPGDKIVLEIRVENKFTSQEDVEIKDIEVKATIEGIDDGEDMEEEADEFDLEADDNDVVYLTFELPNDAEGGNFDVIVEAKGEDDDGVIHTDTFEFSIDVERRTHEVKLVSASFSNSDVKCGENAQLNYEVINIGEKDEDDVKVTVSSSKLKIDLQTSNIEVDSDPDDDNTYSGTFSLAVPETQDEGSYQVIVKAYYDTTILDDSKTISLTVEGCEETPSKNTTTTKPTTNTTVAPPPTLKVPKNATEPKVNATATPIAVTTSIESSFFDSGEYTLFLVLGSVIALLLIVILIAYLIPRKSYPY